MTFYDKVYQIAKQVPKGKVTTYGAIAKAIGSPQAGRVVGYALNSKKFNLGEIPAHRVVNRNGLLTGKKHFPRNAMQELLINEGINIKDNKIINFEEYFWQPKQIIII